MKLPKDMKKWVKLARKQGWTVEPTKNGHILFVSPTGEHVPLAGTASDHRTMLNSRACLRRAGLKGI